MSSQAVVKASVRSVIFEAGENEMAKNGYRVPKEKIRKFIVEGMLKKPLIRVSTYGSAELTIDEARQLRSQLKDMIKRTEAYHK